MIARCRTFETFSTAVEWIAREKLSIDKLLHLLDDFLTIASTYSVCKAHLDMFISLCNFLGIPIAPDKTFGPSTTLTFAGIELDSLRREARLPRDKIAKCVQLIANFLSYYYFIIIKNLILQRLSFNTPRLLISKEPFSLH